MSTLLATVLALAAGYRAVLWLGAGCYLLAAPCLWAAAADDVTTPGTSGKIAVICSVMVSPWLDEPEHLIHAGRADRDHHAAAVGSG